VSEIACLDPLGEVRAERHTLPLRLAANFGELADASPVPEPGVGGKGGGPLQGLDGSGPPGGVGGAESYVERLPLPALAGAVRTVWVQQTGQRPYVQRNLPTGGVELQCPLGGLPRVIGPLTAARVQVLPPSTTVVGARFWPGAAPLFLGLPVDELLDLSVGLDDLWRGNAVRLGELLAAAPDSLSALEVLQRFLSSRQTRAAPRTSLSLPPCAG
jgi:hypothetical protein